MLVLTRKLQEQIRIGDHVTITVLRVKGQTVRIGIEAPRDVRVVRAELPGGGQVDATPIEAEASTEASGSEAEQGGSAEPAQPAAENQPPADASSGRLPQRRMINRYGAPPLRLACSQALAGAAH